MLWRSGERNGRRGRSDSVKDQGPGMIVIAGWGRIHKDVCYTCCSNVEKSQTVFWFPSISICYELLSETAPSNLLSLRREMIYYLVEHIITLSDLPKSRSFICRVSVTDWSWINRRKVINNFSPHLLQPTFSTLFTICPRAKVISSTPIPSLNESCPPSIYKSNGMRQHMLPSITLKMEQTNFQAKVLQQRIHLAHEIKTIKRGKSQVSEPFVFSRLLRRKIIFFSCIKTKFPLVCSGWVIKGCGGKEEESLVLFLPWRKFN